MPIMIKSLLATAFTVLLMGSTLLAQQGPPSGTPVNSPEPFTLLALAGGAVAAGRLAYRRRKSR